MLWIVLGVIALLLVLLVLLYNRFVTLRNRVDNAWAQVDVQLKRRYDLIPNLVETVKGYAAHERETFEAVTDARARAQAAQGPAEQGAAEGILSQALGRLFAVAEAYPELQADENFRQLQEELATTENRIAVSRQVYNDTVLTYNNAIQTVPGVFFAGPFGFTKQRVLRGRGRSAGGATRRVLDARAIVAAAPRRGARASPETQPPARSRSPSADVVVQVGPTGAVVDELITFAFSGRLQRRRSATSRCATASRSTESPSRRASRSYAPGASTELGSAGGRRARSAPSDATRTCASSGTSRPATRRARSAFTTGCAASRRRTTTSSTSTSRSGATSGRPGSAA